MAELAHVHSGRADAVELPARDLKRTWLTMLGWGAFFVVMAIAVEGADLRFYDLWVYRENMINFAAGFTAPDFSHWQTHLKDMWETIQMALWGTALAVIAGIPLGVMSSENVCPWWVVQPTRRAMDMLRAINEMVFALLFLVAVGLGPFAGVLALFVHTTGVVAKLFSEAVEAIDPRPVEGIRATGATKLQEIIYGVIPQVIPLWISYSLYRFESNVRSATVLGIVGAGGIGFSLYEYIRTFDYSATAAILIIIIVSVSILDLFSQRLRKLFI
jgi:phosphonate transport system permease protein